MLLLLAVLPVAGQDTYYSIFSYDHLVPRVTMNDRQTSLQAGLFPDFYAQHSAAGDMRWVAAHDSALVVFWQSKGDTVLHILCELSGIEWTEAEFDLYLVRLYPSIGSGNPLIIPMGGILSGSLIRAIPTDHRLHLNVIYQLARRMLDQSLRPEDNVFYPMAGHPLMRPGPYRRDNLALVLALATCQNIIGYDSTMEAYRSLYWKQNFPGWEIFDRHFLNKWVVTPDHTLADLIAGEPFNSNLVTITRPPRLTSRRDAGRPRVFVEDLPLKGRLGFSVKLNASNRLQVHKIDVYRLAYACGLREGDEIRRVNGLLVRSHKDLVEKILETFEESGATLQILREGNFESVILQDILMPLYEEEYLEEYYPDEDSLFYDSLYPVDEP